MMKQIIRAVLAGLAIWSGFAPAQFWPATFVGVALLFSAISDQPLFTRWYLSFATGLAFFLPLLHWSSTYVGAVPWLILGFGQALIFSIIALPPIKRDLTGVFAFSAAFLLMEIIRMKFPFGGFGWGRVGFTQVEALTYLYPFIGIAGVGFLVAVLSAAIAMRPIFVLIALPIFAINLFVPNETPDSNDEFRVIAVQGGVDDLGLDFNNRAMRVLQRHINATPRNQSADLIIWPENSVDVDPATNSLAQNKLQKLLSELDAPLLAGVVEQSFLGPKNSSLLYNGSADVVARYVKQDLAPFGEYIPLRKVAESISPFAAQVRDFQAGDKWSAFDINGWSFQSFICFEILDDDHIRAGAENMNFLIAQTNNATFGRSAQAAQQLQITQARAAELGKDFAVVSTTGFTAQIDSRGQITERLPQFEPGALEMRIQRQTEDSLTSQIGSQTWVLIAGLVLLLSLRRSYRYNR